LLPELHYSLQFGFFPFVRTLAVTMADTGVSVIIRVRPLNSRELKTGDKAGFQIDHQSLVSNTFPVQAFTFDSVLGTESTNAEAYDKMQKIVTGAMEGYDKISFSINGTIFAYGQTSSGKTHTMFGTEAEPGTLFSIKVSPQWHWLTSSRIFATVQKESSC
jgi:Kinesin motor domain